MAESTHRALGKLHLALAAALFAVSAAAAAQQGKGNVMELDGVSLSATLSTDRNELRVRYRIRNGRSDDVYVLSGIPARRPDRTPYVQPRGYYLAYVPPDEASVLIGIPPVPKRKLVTVRVIPLGHKLAAGATLDQDLDPIPLPLAEKSPYATEEEKRAMTTLTIRRLWLAVQFVPAGTPGIILTPVDYDQEHVSVLTRLTTDVKEIRVTLRDGEQPLRVLPNSLPSN